MSQNPPAGVPRVLARVTYDDVAGACEYLCATFGFREDAASRFTDADGSITLTEVCIADSRVMLGRSGNHGQQSPRTLGGNTQMLVVYVDGVDAHHEHAVSQGATILLALNDAPWGDRRYEAEDLEGHRWAFHERMA